MLLSKGHANHPAIPPIPDGAKAVRASRTASALSFLLIASAIPLAICVSLLRAFIFVTQSASASSSIVFRSVDRIFCNPFAFIPAVGSPVFV